MSDTATNTQYIRSVSLGGFQEADDLGCPGASKLESNIIRLVMSITAGTNSGQKEDVILLPGSIPDKRTREKIYQALLVFEKFFSPYHPFGSSPGLSPKPNYLFNSLLRFSRSPMERVHASRFAVLCYLLGGAGPEGALMYAKCFDKQRLQTFAQAMYDPRGYDSDRHNLSVRHRSTVSALKKKSSSEIRCVTDAIYNKRGVEDYILQMANNVEALQKDLSIAFDQNLLPVKVAIALATYLY